MNAIQTLTKSCEEIISTGRQIQALELERHECLEEQRALIAGPHIDGDEWHSLYEQQRAIEKRIRHLHGDYRREHRLGFKDN